MADTITYDNFDLVIERRDEARYQARVLMSPGGEACNDFSRPFSGDELQRFRSHVGQRRVAAGVGVRELAAIKTFGTRLFDALLSGTVRECFIRSLAAVEDSRASADGTSRGDRGLRIRLRLNEVPELADLPWEYLHHPEHGFLALSDRSPLVRYMELPYGAAPLAVVLPPLRVLALIASPTDHPPIEVEKEWELLRTASSELERDGLVILDRVPVATIAELQRHLRRQEFHVFHFIGHGGFDARADDGMLVLEDDVRLGSPVDSASLGAILRDEQSLRLVVLNACEGARGSVVDPFAGTAQGLVRHGVPAVIAMQDVVTDGAAITFSEEFYRAIADNYPVDAALAAARKQIFARVNEVEWATPVLYMRAPDGHVFDVARRDQRLLVGDRRLELGGAHGALADVAPVAQHPPARPRPTPIQLHPRPFKGLLDRRTEVTTASAALESAEPVELHGESGVGKTTLLRYLSHTVDSATPFPDGVAYRSARQQHAEDLAQWIYEAFYDCDASVKPTDAAIRHGLRATRALVVFDDVEITGDDLQQLMQVAPKCTFLFASDERRLMGEGRALKLDGLPDEDAAALVERELGRPLGAAEIPAARSLWAALRGNPLRVLQEVARVRDGASSLADAVRRVAQAPPTAPIPAVAQNEPERRVLGVLAAFAGAPLHAQHVGELAEVYGAEVALRDLERRRLVHADGPRYTLAAGAAMADGAPETAQWMERALSHFTEWATQHASLPTRIRDDSGAIMRVLDWAVDAERWDGVSELARSVESALTLRGQWGAWSKVLGHELTAAQALGDRAGEAWALHQSGTRAMVLEQHVAAREALTRAVELREQLGDRPGAEVSRHNLSLVRAVPPPPREPDPPRTVRTPRDPGQRPTPGWMKAARWGVPAAVLVAAAGLGAREWLGGDDVADSVPIAVDVTPEPTRDTASPSDSPAVTPQPATPTPVGHLTVDTTLDFQERDLRTTTGRALVFGNDGAAPLRVRSINIEGAPEFTIGDDQCSGVAIDRAASCPVTVRFTPTALGGRQATLLIHHGTPRDVRRVALRGVAVGPSANLSSTAITFDPQVAKTRSRVQVLELGNAGSRPLGVDSIAVTGAHSGDFVVRSDCANREVVPAARCSIGVVFSPAEVGSRRGTLEIAFASPESSRVVGLSGIAIPPPAPAVVLEPTTVDFGMVGVSRVMPVIRVVLTNAGAAPLVVRSVRIDDTTHFQVAGDCVGQTRQAGEQCTVAVGFRSRRPGSHRAVVLVEDNAPDSPQRVQVTGSNRTRPGDDVVVIDSTRVLTPVRPAVLVPGVEITRLRGPSATSPGSPDSAATDSLAHVSCAGVVLRWTPGARRAAGFLVTLEKRSRLGWEPVVDQVRTAASELDVSRHVEERVGYRWRVQTAGASANDRLSSDTLWFSCSMPIR